MEENVELTQTVIVKPADDHNGGAKTGLVLEIVRDRLAEQLRQVSALDARAGFILGSASLLTSVLALYRAPQLTSSSIFTLLLGVVAQSAINAVPFVGIGTYIAVVLTSYMSYLLTSWTNAPEPNRFVESAHTMSRFELEEKLIENILNAINKNERKLAAKVWWMRLAFVSLSLEIGVVAILLLVSNLPPA